MKEQQFIAVIMQVLTGTNLSHSCSTTLNETEIQALLNSCGIKGVQHFRMCCKWKIHFGIIPALRFALRHPDIDSFSHNRMAHHV